MIVPANASTLSLRCRNLATYAVQGSNTSTTAGAGSTQYDYTVMMIACDGAQGIQYMVAPAPGAASAYIDVYGYMETL
jgi:hypothetical protein